MTAMKTTCLRAVSICVVLATITLLDAAVLRGAEVVPEEGFVSMFNGKDLTGWEGKPGWWHVEDGAITSESTKDKPCTACNYLMWRTAQPADFELRCEYRLVGGNSGIQFRSRELPNWDTYGYQADMEAGEQWTGCLFHHKHGGVAMRGQKVTFPPEGKKQIEPLADAKELMRSVKKDQWNTYRILARGDEIILEINGRIMTQVRGVPADGASRGGVIALQMHPGPPMKVQFRNLRIKILDQASKTK